MNRRKFVASSSLAALSVTAGAVFPRGLLAASPADRARRGSRNAADAAKGGPILRYYIRPETRDEHLAELITTCERVGITEVALFTTEYLGASRPSRAMPTLN